MHAHTHTLTENHTDLNKSVLVLCTLLNLVIVVCIIELIRIIWIFHRNIRWLDACSLSFFLQINNKFFLCYCCAVSTSNSSQSSIPSKTVFVVHLCVLAFYKNSADLCGCKRVLSTFSADTQFNDDSMSRKQLQIFGWSIFAHELRTVEDYWRRISYSNTVVIESFWLFNMLTDQRKQKTSEFSVAIFMHSHPLVQVYFLNAKKTTQTNSHLNQQWQTIKWGIFRSEIPYALVTFPLCVCALQSSLFSWSFLVWRQICGVCAIPQFARGDSTFGISGITLFTRSTSTIYTML